MRRWPQELLVSIQVVPKAAGGESEVAGLSDLGWAPAPWVQEIGSRIRGFLRRSRRLLAEMSGLKHPNPGDYGPDLTCLLHCR